MLTSVVAIAVTVATGATAVASALPPQKTAIDGIVTSALPPPPQQATIQAAYGPVTLDHENHLAMRVACRSCHASGRIGPVHLGADVAHQTCKGCHRTEQRGPVACTGCHERPVRGPEPAGKVASPSAAQAEAGTPSPERAPGAPAATEAAADAGARTPVAVAVGAAVPAVPAEAEQPEPYKRITLEGGFTALQGTEQAPVVGPFLQLRTRRGAAVFTTGIELAGGVRTGRTVGLLGGGMAFPVAPRWNLMTLGLLGFDIDNAALALFPLFGVRAGVEWTRYSHRTINVFGLSVTAARDFGGRRHQPAEMGTVWSLALSAGNEVAIPRRAPHDWW